MQYKHTCIPPNMQQDMLLSYLHTYIGEHNWIQTRQSLMIEWLYFLGTHRSYARAEYSAWTNYLDEMVQQNGHSNIIKQG
jgi:hypothetical protein